MNAFIIANVFLWNILEGYWGFKKKCLCWAVIACDQRLRNDRERITQWQHEINSINFIMHNSHTGHSLKKNFVYVILLTLVEYFQYFHKWITSSQLAEGIQVIFHTGKSFIQVYTSHSPQNQTKWTFLISVCLNSSELKSHYHPLHSTF